MAYYGEGLTLSYTAYGQSQTGNLTLTDNCRKLAVAIEYVTTNGGTAPTLTDLAQDAGVLALINNLNITGSKSSRSIALGPYGLVMGNMLSQGGRLPRSSLLDDATTSAAVNRKATAIIDCGFLQDETTLAVSCQLAAAATLMSANAATFSSAKIIIRPYYDDVLAGLSYLEDSITLSTSAVAVSVKNKGLIVGIGLVPLDGSAEPDLDMLSRVELKQGNLSVAVISELAGRIELVNAMGMWGTDIAPSSEPYEPQIAFLPVDGEPVDPALTTLYVTGTGAGTCKILIAVADPYPQVRPADTPSGKIYEASQIAKTVKIIKNNKVVKELSGKAAAQMMFQKL